MLKPGDLLRNPDFMVLTATQRGAFFSLMLYMWEGHGIPYDQLPELSGLGAAWPEHEKILRPLFDVQHGQWSIGWLNRYARGLRIKQESGRLGAVATNSKRKQLRESAGGTVPTHSVSGSSSDSDSNSKKKKRSAASAASSKPNTGPTPLFTPEEEAPPDEAGRAMARASVERVREMTHSGINDDPEPLA